MGTCNTGQIFFDISKETRCPAFSWTTEGSRCGLMTEPERFAPMHAKIHGPSKMRDAAKLLLGAGTGCDTSYTDEPKNEAFRQRMLRGRLTNEKIRNVRKALGKAQRGKKWA